MDKYLVKMQRPSSSQTSNNKNRKPALKQTKIGELKGVVSVDRINQAKQDFCNPDADEQTIIGHLNYLCEKQPPIKVMQDSKIGRALKKLSKTHESPSVVRLANQVIDQWTTQINTLRNRQSIEVRLEPAAQKLRDKAVQMFYDVCVAVSKSAQLRVSCCELEQQVFTKCHRKTTHVYRTTVRKITMRMKNDDQLVHDLLTDHKTNAKKIVEKFV